MAVVVLLKVQIVKNNKEFILRSLAFMVVIVAIVVGVFFFQTQTEPVPAVSSKLNVSMPRQTSMNRPSAVASAEAKTEPGPAAMGQAFYRSTNLREFLRYAKNHPEQGGLSYAARALVECEARSKLPKQLSYDGKENPNLYARKQEVLNRNHLLCANLLAEEYDLHAFGMTLTEAEEKKDPHISWQTEFSRIAQEKKDPALAQAFIEKWLNWQDPYLIEQQGNNILASQGNPGSYWFDGKYYNTQEEKRELGIALSLAACAFGSDCSRYSLRWTTQCVEYSKCYDDSFDAFKQLNNESGQYERIYSHYQRLVSAIQRKDLNAFVNPAMPKFKAVTK